MQILNAAFVVHVRKGRQSNFAYMILREAMPHSMTGLSLAKKSKVFFFFADTVDSTIGSDFSQA